MNTQKQTTETKQPPKLSLVVAMAARDGVDPDKWLNVVKQTLAQQAGKTLSDEELMTILMVANEYQLSPWLKQIYAFVAKGGGIVPVVGVDGWIAIAERRPEYRGVSFEYAEEMVTNQGGEHPPCPAWIATRVHRADRENAPPLREYFDECYRAPFVKEGRKIPGPWQSHPKRFLRHKSLIQALRVTFGLTGIYDEDEARRIVEAADGTSTTLRIEDGRSRSDQLAAALRGNTQPVEVSAGEQNTTSEQRAEDEGPQK